MLSKVSEDHLQSEWIQLPTELWNDILRRIGPDHKLVHSGSLLEAVKRQQDLLSIRHVCSKLNNVLCTGEEIVKALVVSNNVADTTQPGLSKWLRQHGAAVHTLAYVACYSSLHNDTLLRTTSRSLTWAHLDCSTQQNSLVTELATTLRCIVLAMKRALSLDVLCNFTCLTKCKLMLYKYESADVTPLASLDLLCDLSLVSGTFTANQLPSRLTSFSIQDASLHVFASNCLCVRSLQKLEVIRSNLTGLRPIGLACVHCFTAAEMQRLLYWR